jgi:uridine kinase
MGSQRLNITLDGEHAAKLARLAARVHVNEGTLAFHHPPAIRYRRGRRSPEGFFLHSYDYGALRRLLLEP